MDALGVNVPGNKVSQWSSGFCNGLFGAIECVGDSSKKSGARGKHFGILSPFEIKIKHQGSHCDFFFSL